MTKTSLPGGCRTGMFCAGKAGADALLERHPGPDRELYEVHGGGNGCVFAFFRLGAFAFQSVNS